MRASYQTIYQRYYAHLAFTAPTTRGVEPNSDCWDAALPKVRRRLVRQGSQTAHPVPSARAAPLRREYAPGGDRAPTPLRGRRARGGINPTAPCG
jgi:hypothetical protein